MRPAFGAGAERLGLLSVRFPIPAWIGVLLISGILGLALPQLSFEGDVLRLMDKKTASWQAFETISSEFPTAMPGISVLAYSDSQPPDNDWLGRLQDLHLELQLMDSVAEVQSVFSLRQSDGQGGSQPLLNPFDAPVAPESLDGLATANPLVPLFLRPDQGLALLSISLRDEQQLQTAEAALVVAQVSQTAAASGIRADVSGRLAADVEVSRILQRDLLRMVLYSVLVGWLVGYMIFTDIRVVAITNLVAPAAMLWTAGVAAALGISLDSATVILPLLAAIIAFADAVHLVVPLQRELAAGVALAEALPDVIRRVGPATALTSMTTAAAFGALALAGGGLVNMALIGVLAVGLAWVSVMTLCPLLCLWLGRGGLGRSRLPTASHAAGFWKIARHCIENRRLVMVAALGVVATLAVVQTQFRSVHQPMSYMPQDTDFLQANQALSDAFSGASTLLIRVPLAVPGAPGHADNRAQLARWHAAIASVAGEEAVWSRASLTPELAALLPEDAGDLSPGASHALVAVRHDWDAPGTDLSALKSAIRAAIAPLPGGGEATISGVATAIAEGARANIDLLRVGLFFSAGFAACLVMLFSGSASAGAGTGLAVLLSVLLVLTLSALPHGLVDYGLMVALMISIGIAIDDGIHLVNYAHQSPYFETSAPRAFADAIEEAGPAIVFSSAILVASLSVTQVAEMPAIRSIGREIIAALLVALVLTLTVVPAAVLATGEALARFRSGKGQQHE